MQTAFGLTVFVGAACLVVWHLKTLRASNEGEHAEFQERQTRFRLLTSSMIGLLGLAIAGGRMLEDPILATYYWIAVLAVTLLIMGMAFYDAFKTRQFLANNDFGIHDAARDLAVELKRIQREKQEDENVDSNQ